MSYEDTGRRIKERRKEMNISANVLAEKIGLSKATIHRYENGDIKNIKLPVLEAMADTLKVSPAWLLGKSEFKDNQSGYDVCEAIEAVILNLKTYDTVVCHGNKASDHVRKHLILALEIVKSASHMYN